MRNVIAAAALAVGLASPAPAQDRIAYANVEVLLALIPGSKEVSQQLESYHGELAKGLETKRAYAQQKLVEARDAAASGIMSDAKLAEVDAELRELDREIQQSAAEADQKILQRRAELMQPVVTKLEETIRAVAEAEGYTLVLNSVDGAGISIVLYGSEERDLTERVRDDLEGTGAPSPPARSARLPEREWIHGTGRQNHSRWAGHHIVSRGM